MKKFSTSFDEGKTAEPPKARRGRAGTIFEKKSPDGPGLSFERALGPLCKGSKRCEPRRVFLSICFMNS